MRQCSTCKVSKELQQFHKSSKNKGGNHELLNLQILTAEENRRKGAKYE
jgi:5-methylcytosine-specific restriction endonuclease McrA